MNINPLEITMDPIVLQDKTIHVPKSDRKIDFVVREYVGSEVADYRFFRADCEASRILSAPGWLRRRVQRWLTTRGRPLKRWHRRLDEWANGAARQERARIWKACTLRNLKDLEVGSQLVIPSIFWDQVATVQSVDYDRNEAYAQSESTGFHMVFNADDRHAWVCTVQINLAGLERIELNLKVQ